MNTKPQAYSAPVPAARPVGCSTLDFLTRRVRALISQVGSRKPTVAEQSEAQELQGRLSALRRASEKHFA
jgi:hypothetical protein